MDAKRPAAGRGTRADTAVNQTREGVIAGRNGVLEALKGGAAIEKIYVSKTEKEGSIIRILALARERRIVVAECDRVKLDFLCGIKTHQGIAATLQQTEYCEIADILALARERGETPLVVVADEIEDPYNLGAIIRTAECAGAHGVIIPKHRGTGVTPAVTKASAGAVFHMKIAKAVNLAQALDELKQGGLWVYGADGGAERSLYETDLSGPAAVVIGSEGRGIGRLLREKCDFLVSIPLGGRVNSLNASVAAGIVLFEIVRQRGVK